MLYFSILLIHNHTTQNDELWKGNSGKQQLIFYSQESFGDAIPSVHVCASAAMSCPVLHSAGVDNKWCTWPVEYIPSTESRRVYFPVWSDINWGEIWWSASNIRTHHLCLTFQKQLSLSPLLSEISHHACHLVLVLFYLEIQTKPVPKWLN